MKIKVLIVVIGLALAGILSACGAAAPAASAGGNVATVSVTANGQVYIVPDLAYINIGVQSEADEVAAALALNTEQAQAIRTTLTGLGVEDSDIQTTAFNVYPYQNYDPMGQPSETVYAVQNTVNVTVRDLTNLGDLLDAVVRSGANTINSISFDASEKSAAYTEARKLAVENANVQAAELAEAAGVTLGRLVNISTYNNTAQPLYDYKMYGAVGGADASVPVAAGQIVVSVDVSLAYEIE
jgi:uncharacterized protein YggE